MFMFEVGEFGLCKAYSSFDVLVTHFNQIRSLELSSWKVLESLRNVEIQISTELILTHRSFSFQFVLQHS